MNLLFSIRNGVQRVRDTWAYKKAMREYLKSMPLCECCGAKKMLFRIRLEVHHITPVSVAPQFAAAIDNMMTMCASCHFHVGHLGNWRTHNANLRETIAAMRRAWVDYQRRELA